MTNWQSTYPTLADVHAADIETCCAWLKELSAPQTDVERTIQRRLSRKAFAAAGPEIEGKLNDLYREFQDFTGVNADPRKA